MAMNTTVHLRYIGVIPQPDFLEYGFRIEDKDKEPRLIVLMIESELFKRYALMFQEAPDLCYQKLLADLRNETAEYPVNPRLSITATDIASYRELHPVGKSSKLRNRSAVAFS
jgi:superfamily I DNA and/or RNA helicase